MTADELRELAQKIEEKWWRWKDNPTIELKAAAYLRACADALDAGPVAWREEVRGTGERETIAATGWRYYGLARSQKEADAHVRRCTDGIEGRAVPLYPLAMPAQAQPLRLPEPMTDDDVHRVSGAQRDAMLDHIYEYGTGAEGIMQRVTQLARAIETETLRRVKEANK